MNDVLLFSFGFHHCICTFGFCDTLSCLDSGVWVVHLHTMIASGGGVMVFFALLIVMLLKSLPGGIPACASPLLGRRGWMDFGLARYFTLLLIAGRGRVCMFHRC